PPPSSLFPYTTLFRSAIGSTGLTILGVFTLLAGILLVTGASVGAALRRSHSAMRLVGRSARRTLERPQRPKTESVRYYADEPVADRKSTRLNSSHVSI